MTKILLPASLALGLLLWLAVSSIDHRNHRVLASAASTAMPEEYAKTLQQRECPEKQIKLGMLKEDVRAQLPNEVMNYQGTRQDEDFYDVGVSECTAKLAFRESGELESLEHKGRIQILPSKPAVVTAPPIASAEGASLIGESSFAETIVEAASGMTSLSDSQLKDQARTRYRFCVAQGVTTNKELDTCAFPQ